MKKCITCQKRKELSEFYFRTDCNSYKNECKVCLRKRSNKRHHNNTEQIKSKAKNTHDKYPWKRTLKAIRQRCTNKNGKKWSRYGGRGIQCRITEEELKELWFRDKAYLMKKASIDREDNDGNYEYSNCRYLEFDLNTKRANDSQQKIIVQFDLEDNFIREWEGIMLTSRLLNIQHSNIIAVLKNRRNNAGGFKWRYKNV